MAKEGATCSREMVSSVPRQDHHLMYSFRSREHISLFTLHGEPLFFQHFDGPYFPTLRLLHKCAHFPD
jgi:predicted ribosome-associated RNA-binding protein Tma20